MRHSLSALLACALVGSWWWWSENPQKTSRAIADESSATKSDTTSKRLKIQLELNTAEDMKVKEGQRVLKGQLIATDRRQQITAPYAGSIARVRLLSTQGGLLKYEVVLLCSPPPRKTPSAPGRKHDFAT